MPKKFGVNEKKEEAYAKKQEKAASEKQAAQKQAEDQYWHDDGDKNM